MFAAPLTELSRNNVKFNWTLQRQNAYYDIKAALETQTLRVHFEENRPLILATEASPYNFGAVLMQKHDDGIEHMVTCASRTLSATERQCAQIENEALSIVFGFKRFRQYVVGREVLFYTDHKPLTFIFKPNAGISQTALHQIQRWSLYLANFSYVVQHRPGRHTSQADALSRSPQKVNDELEAEVNVAPLEQMESGPISVIDVSRVGQATSRDPLRARVVDFVQHGWPIHCPNEDIRQYFIHRDELTVQDGVLLWGLRVVVPPPLQSEVLALLHESRPGCTRWKQLARSYVLLPGIDADNERVVHSRQSCAEQRRETNTPVLGR